MDRLDLQLKDEAMTARWAARLADALAAEPLAEQAFVLHLSGELGAGKTTLVRALLRRLGFQGPVKSPSFALLEPYNLAKFAVYHFDLYRFSSSDQWFDAGFDDILAGAGLVLIEWPEKAAGALPGPDLRITLEVAGAVHERELHLQALSPAGIRCLTRIPAPRPAAAPFQGAPPAADS